jgi:RNA polymerase sigma-70 factor (ECF subfamily)
VDSADSTSVSLIRRVRLREEGAWDRLARLYGPLVYSWARRHGLHESDAADVVQEVFRCVFQAIEQFQRQHADSSFRGWLRAITRNQINLHFRRLRSTHVGVGGSEADLRMQQVADVADENDADSIIDNRQLIRRALDMVRGDFNETTWQCFWRMVMLGQATAEIAAELGLTETAVRQAKFRVLTRLREQLDDRWQ